MTLSEVTESAGLWQFFNPPALEVMAFPGFSLVSNPEFQQRWDFRNQDVDSSSDDGKSQSGVEPTLKKHQLVPGLTPPENDEPAHSPECREEITNPEGGCGIVTPNPKEAGRRRRKEKLIKEKKVIKNSRVDRGCRKRKNIVYDAGLIDDLQKFRESLVEELRIERENLVGRMKDEMNEKAGNNRCSIGGERKEEANHVDKILLLQNQSSEDWKKSAGDAKKSRSRRPARTSRRKKADTGSCSQALANEKGELLETDDKSKFPFLPLDRSLQLQQDNFSHGHRTPVSAALIENDKGGSLELLCNMNRSSSHQSSQVLVSNFLTLPGNDNHRLESSSVDFPSRISGKKVDTDEISGYYHLLLQEAGASTNSGLIEPKNNTSLPQTMFLNPLHRDTTRDFSSTNTIPLSSQNPSGHEDNALGARMNGGKRRFLGYGNNYV